MSTGPFGSAISSRYFVDSGVPVIRGGNLSQDVGTRLNHEDLVFITEDKAGEFERSTVKRGDLVFTCWGTIDQVGLIDERSHYEEYVISNKQMKMTPDPTIADSRFLYYQFSSPKIKGWIIDNGIGSSVPGFNLGMLKSIELNIPPLPEQKAIAHILGTFDDKIELNRKTNEALEAMARALFKSWFVDFNPVRAKAEGRSTGLPAEISDLFPDSFEDSELGEIPSGWQVSSLGKVIELAYGKPLKEEQRKGGNYPVFGSNGVVGSHDEYLVEAPGIVVGRKGNPGTVEWSGMNFHPIDTTFFVVNKMKGLGMRFLFYCLKNQNLADLSADSAVPGLNRNHAYMNNQLLPPIDVASAFERHLEVIFKRKEFLADEINALSAIRDALLTKLISGEIRIPDAEELLASVL